MAFQLPRRAVLQGLFGASIALPLLEVMVPRRASAQAAGGSVAPMRYLVCFGGQSLGCDGDDELSNEYVPTIVGRGYDLRHALAPLAPVRDEVSVISGLRIPTSADNGGTIPAGGRPVDFHVTSLSALLSGVRYDESGFRVAGETSDQVVARAIAGDTIHKVLAYRAQAGWYLSVSAPYGRDVMSYRVDGGGNLQEVLPTVSPKQAYDTLFFQFTPPDSEEDRARADFLLRRRKSVLDLVRGNTERLLPKLGAADKQRMERHLDELRALELRVNAIPPVAAGECRQLADPGADPAFGGDQGTDGNGDNTYDTSLGYSDEETRLRAFCDLVHMAFTCDLSRVGTLMFTMAQSHMNMHALTGHAYDLHELGHSGRGTRLVSDGIAWHMKHFAYLVGKFRDTPDLDGTLLDHSAILMLHEGGHGHDPSSGEQHSSHSTENMACLLAGRAGGLAPGQHVVAPPDRNHPANVVISAMRAVGVDGPLGEVSGHVPELFG